jgi:hypothetical protein
VESDEGTDYRTHEKQRGEDPLSSRKKLAGFSGGQDRGNPTGEGREKAPGDRHRHTLTGVIRAVGFGDNADQVPDEGGEADEGECPAEVFEPGLAADESSALRAKQIRTPFNRMRHHQPSIS